MSQHFAFTYHLVSHQYPTSAKDLFQRVQKEFTRATKFRPWQDSNQEKAMKLTPTRATTPTDI
jgi:hypothetical protein